MWVDLILELCVFKTILIIWLSEAEARGEKKLYENKICKYKCSLFN